MTKEIKIYYFSGTGNTSLILNNCINYLEEAGKEVTTIEIGKGLKPEITDKQTLGIFFPVNSHSTMPFIWEFIKKLPKVNNNRVFFIYTCNNSAAISNPLSKLLMKKGYRIIGVEEIVMPNNMVIKNKPEDHHKERTSEGIKTINMFTESLINSSKIDIKKQTGSSFVSFLTRNTPIPWMVMRLFFKFQISDTCTNCNLCVNSCPVSNIRNNGITSHKSKCEFCMKCIANCPQKAISFKNNSKIEVKRSKNQSNLVRKSS